jgi:hypothetical protein
MIDVAGQHPLAEDLVGELVAQPLVGGAQQVLQLFDQQIHLMAPRQAHVVGFDLFPEARVEHGN